MRLTYAKCAELLGNRERKKLAGNTYLINDGGGFFVVFHSTPILRYYSDGRVVVSGGGYRSVTTKSRLNEYGPFGVWQKAGKWYCDVDGVEMPFRDGLTFDTYPDGSASGISERVPLTNNPEERALTESVLRGECPAGVVTDWRKENGVLPV